MIVRGEKIPSTFPLAENGSGNCQRRHHHSSENELAEFRGHINQKHVKINADVEQQNDKIEVVLTRTKEVQQWSTDAKRALNDILKKKKDR